MVFIYYVFLCADTLKLLSCFVCTNSILTLLTDSCALQGQNLAPNKHDSQCLSTTMDHDEENKEIAMPQYHAGASSASNKKKQRQEKSRISTYPPQCRNKVKQIVMKEGYKGKRIQAPQISTGADAHSARDVSLRRRCAFPNAFLPPGCLHQQQAGLHPPPSPQTRVIIRGSRLLNACIFRRLLFTPTGGPRGVPLKTPRLISVPPTRPQSLRANFQTSPPGSAPTRVSNSPLLPPVTTCT
jgi:hypothetical protein